MENEGKPYILCIDFFFICVTQLLIEFTKQEEILDLVLSLTKT